MKLLVLSAYFLAVECSSFSPRIISENYAKSMEDFPYIVSLWWYKQIWINGQEKRASFSCGGSIIAKHVVLTAAHCLFDVQLGTFVNPKNTTIVVKAGSLKGPKESDNNTSEMQNTTVAKFIVHHDYIKVTVIRYNNYYSLANARDHNYDVALMKLRKPFDVNGRWVKIIPLAPSGYVPQGNAIESGWGREDVYVRDNGSKTLKFANMKILNETECMNRGSGALPKKMICAYTHTQGSCLGDSGGPLVQTIWNPQNNKTENVLVGVDSFEKEKSDVNNIARNFCGVSPEYYVSVPDFRQYIENTITKL